MSFDQTAILDVAASRRGADLVVSWSSSAPAGTAYQVYLDRLLAWSGRSRSCLLPYPGATARVEVGAVADAEIHADLSGSLPTPPGGGGRVTLAWSGGTFLGPTIEAFRVYSGTAPGGAVGYAAPVATVTAYAGGIATDGYGMGGYGGGGYGHAAGSYSWTSDPLAPGLWNFAVRPVDAAGNEGASALSSAAVAGPPRPPARNAAGVRVTAAVHRQAPGGYGFGSYGAGGYGEGAVATGYGMGGYGTGGYGAAGAGYGAGGYGVGGYGTGAGDGPPYATVSWLASPGY